MPLTMAGIGETNTISRIGGNEETRRFLANLGFVAGAEVVVLSKLPRGVRLDVDYVVDRSGV